MKMQPGHAELILGGARSGKSALAEQRARQAADMNVIYVATGEARDGEMARRITHHRERRPASWGLVEEPLYLAAALEAHARPDTLLLVDCLTLWLSNLIFGGRAADQVEAGPGMEWVEVDCPLLRGEIEALERLLPVLPGRVILVSNEVGWGIVPLGAVSRLFADEQGRLNQRIAAACRRVTLVAAGLPLELKTGDQP
ncbi:bifunctional adenosylcobinamide kinase/adenosylcobinamide-phosphate guanylyltransferase [Denitratisoma oestradiolicum]|uniref:Bifunctional adenosylcobalamin biosynthesis protein n=1 Tax=Denitratisoma oestradiolicum TaxID=311182 RepID=A0A6S6XY09_9PROT|nr:bifunctional adenosylcobinamide kinase/adenosylcobinamide-phosphate guanylyltransferase [Denitratisoma oestradiolicum]CAB1367749.1 Bifunctional adenosylcobalamin biosynthesis protein CobP [Denitratisoma oestradiolicum]